jgi:hypothetical protein
MVQATYGTPAAAEGSEQQLIDWLATTYDDPLAFVMGA